jgi:hypothetical protein
MIPRHWVAQETKTKAPAGTGGNRFNESPHHSRKTTADATRLELQRQALRPVPPAATYLTRSDARWLSVSGVRP